MKTVPTKVSEVLFYAEREAMITALRLKIGETHKEHATIIIYLKFTLVSKNLQANDAKGTGVQ